METSASSRASSAMSGAFSDLSSNPDTPTNEPAIPFVGAGFSRFCTHICQRRMYDVYRGDIMNYNIQYEMSIPTVTSTSSIHRKQRNNKKVWIAACAIASFLAVCISTDILVPGDKEVTKMAVSELIEDVKGGERVVDAFATFCQTVLEGG